MAGEPAIDDGLDDNTEVETPEIEDTDDSTEEDGAEGDDDTSHDTSEEDEFVIEGDEPGAEDESSTIRRLRQRIDDLTKTNKQLKGKVPPAGPKPSLADFDYDEAKYDEAVDKWKAAKAEEAAAAPSDDAAEVYRNQIEESRSEYRQQAAKLNVRDFDLAEARVIETLSEPQQAALLLAAKNKAAVVAALGKHPTRLAELAKIENPIKLAVAVSDIERNIKVNPRRTAPEPEPRQKGGGSPVVASQRDKQIAALENKIAQGGDQSDNLRRLRELRNARR